MIEDYDDQYDEDIQWKTASRKEFFELKGKTQEKKPDPGEFFSHQNLFLRYAIQYDRIFNIHETGTGKTGSVINLCEHYRVKEPGKIKRFIILQPGPPTVEDFKDQIVKLAIDDFYETDTVLNATDDKSLKNNLTRLINRNYEVTTYQKFFRDDVSLDKIESYYSDCIFFFDEAHKLRNLSDNSGGKLNDLQLDKIYDYLWKITHTAKRCKVIISTATPMINTVKDFVPLINLLLDENKQFPTVKDEEFYEKLTLKQVEPYFRGIFTYVRFLDTLNINNMGSDFNNFKHIMKIPKERESEDLIPDKKAIKEGRIIVVNQKSQPKNQFKEEKITSQIKIYSVQMRGKQLEVYKEVSKKKQDSFFRESRQSSTFVFPNGYYGTKGFNHYIEKDDYQNYRFKPSFMYKGEKVTSLKAYLRPDDIDATLNNLQQLSCKFAEFIKIEHTASLEEKPGNTFAYLDQVEGSGVILLGLILERLGFENFISNDSTIVNTKTGKIREGFEKKKRFALITGKTTNLRNILKVFNSMSNMDGEYIQILLASEVARDGINIKNVLRGYILSAGWHESGMHQALSRFIRADSHTELLNRHLLDFGEKVPKNYKIKVDVYRMAAVQPGELSREISDYSKTSIDIRNYLESEKKDIRIKRITRFMKVCAFDAYLNYERNFRKADKEFAKVSDYSVKFPKIWKSRGAPNNDKRQGLALNQGPCEKELVYNTYNLLYSSEDQKCGKLLRRHLYEILSQFEYYPIEGLLKTLRDDIRYDSYKIFRVILKEIYDVNEKQKSKDNLFQFSVNVLGENIYISRKNLYNYNNFLSTENYYSFMEFRETDQTEEDIFKEEKLDKLYSALKDKTKNSIIELYQIDQNYGDYKLLLEDSLIRLKQDRLEETNRQILDLFRNYWMDTKIPEGWIAASEGALKGTGERKQGRKRAEGSEAGLKTLELNKVKPQYSKDTVFIHFYRESDKTAFSITSILEGKDRKIRILKDQNFMDATTVEKFVYTKLFDNYYDKLMEKYKKSRFYGSYIFRGGEQEPVLKKRQKEFFRIIDTKNKNNKGRVCTSFPVDFIQEVLKFLDTAKEYKQYYNGKIDKDSVCRIIKDLFKKKDLLFVSL